MEKPPRSCPAESPEKASEKERPRRAGPNNQPAPCLGSGLQVNAPLPSPQNPQAVRHLGQPRDERHVTALRLLSQ